MLYDQLANRWFVSQIGTYATGDECIAVSTSSDATGAWHRYAFHLGPNEYDYPKFSVWPDAYYLSANVFTTANGFLGPQPFAFDRSAMLAGNPTTFVAPVAPLGSSADFITPADLDGSILPASGAPETFVSYPGAGNYNIYHFHADFITPANSTWTTFASPPAAAFTAVCPGSRDCVPELNGENVEDMSSRVMFRAAYRKFPDGHEALVGNYAVSSGGVGAIRWFEIRNVSSGPVQVVQESTYQPDSTWRWEGSIAMDGSGDLALGFSASSASIYPQIRYAGRLVTDPINTLGQGEATLIAGTGSQSSGGNRWGDYSDLTIDPVGQLHFLVHARILRGHRHDQLADAHWQLQVPLLQRNPAHQHGHADGYQHALAHADLRRRQHARPLGHRRALPGRSGHTRSAGH